MDINEAKDFLENRINPNMVETILNAAIEEGKKMAKPMIVNITKNGNIYTADKTYAEIKAGLPNVQLSLIDGAMTQHFYYYTNYQTWIDFCSLDLEGDEALHGTKLSINDDNSIDYFSV